MIATQMMLGGFNHPYFVDLFDKSGNTVKCEIISCGLTLDESGIYRYDIECIPLTSVDYFLFTPDCYNEPMKLNPKKVIFSGPATTILWTDGTKTTVKCSMEEEYFDEEKGIAMCYLKKMFGNKGNFNNIFREAMAVSEDRNKATRSLLETIMTKVKEDKLREKGASNETD